MINYYPLENEQKKYGLKGHSVLERSISVVLQQTANLVVVQYRNELLRQTLFSHIKCLFIFEWSAFAINSAHATEQKKCAYISLDETAPDSERIK